MDRREFLSRGAGALLVLPFGLFLVRCSSSDGGGTTTYTPPTQPAPTPTGNPPAAPPSVQGQNVVYTSSVTNLHSHSFAVPSAAFSSPPAAGISGDTSLAQAHNHSLVITQADLQAAAAGQTVIKESSNTLGHTHTFTIVKVA